MTEIESPQEQVSGLIDEAEEAQTISLVAGHYDGLAEVARQEALIEACLDEAFRISQEAGLEVDVQQAWFAAAHEAAERAYAAVHGRVPA